LQTISSGKALAMLNVGDREHHHHGSPGYLNGGPGTVVELDEHSDRLRAPPGRPLHQRGDPLPACPLHRLSPAASQKKSHLAMSRATKPIQSSTALIERDHRRRLQRRRAAN
jgi:hypothetical protein